MKFYSKYPFMKGALALVKDKGITIEALLKDLAYEPARVRGKERVAEAIELGTVDDRALVNEAEQLAEILSYPIARMIVSCTGDKYLIGRYALGEAMLLEMRLIEEDREGLKSTGEELGVVFSRNGDRNLIHFTTFLSATSKIRAKEWKLVNQELIEGMVRISDERLARVLRQKLNDRIMSELPLEVTDEIFETFGKEAKTYSRQLASKRKEFVPGDMGPIDDASFPPCMKTILTMIRNGENVPHTARFSITAFLHTLGMDSEMIIKAFSTAPDFDASKSEYQVRHIVGEISGTEYTPPECSTMKSYGICYNPDRLCEKEWMTHPLKYYRTKRKGRKSGKRPPDSDKALKNGNVRRENEDDEQKVEKRKGKSG